MDEKIAQALESFLAPTPASKPLTPRQELLMRAKTASEPTANPTASGLSLDWLSQFPPDYDVWRLDPGIYYALPPGEWFVVDANEEYGAVWWETVAAGRDELQEDSGAPGGIE